MSKLTYSLVKQLRAEHAAGATISALARREGVRIQNMRKALRGESWREDTRTWVGAFLDGSTLDLLRDRARENQLTLEQVLEAAVQDYLKA